MVYKTLLKLSQAYQIQLIAGDKMYLYVDINYVLSRELAYKDILV